MKLNLYRDLKIKYSAVLPLGACNVTKPELLSRHGIGKDGSVLLFLLPYLTKAAEGGNLSAYAAPRDYHRVFAETADLILPKLCAERPDAVFAAYADHSPISEKLAAASAGLGRIGRHSLLVNDEHASFVFIGGIYSSLPARDWLDLTDGSAVFTDADSLPGIRPCDGCGACVRACPSGAVTENGIDVSRCLSALSQKKRLTDSEKSLLSCSPYVWGCDVCQLVCPVFTAAKESGTVYTPLTQFQEEVIPDMNEKTLDELIAEGKFEDRAYSWRGRETVSRNIELHGLGKTANAIVETVIAAGRELTKIAFVTDGILVKDGDDNFATEYDVMTQRRLIRELSEIVPDAHFLAEEDSGDSTESAVSEGFFFVIDPIDGTTNFMHDVKHSAVSVALLRDGVTVFGCVYNPYLDECFCAERGRGAFLRVNGETRRISVSERPLHDALAAFGTTPYEKRHAESTFSRVCKLFGRCRDVRREGSAALDMCYVAAGRYDVYFELALSPWDFAASALILTEAGGILTDLNGAAIDVPKKTSVLATTAAAHEEAASVLAE